MKSLTTAEFWRAYRQLPPKLKVQARKTYAQWRQNPRHPSLHFKKVGKALWSVRITGGYRALAIKKGDDYYWFWIGPHDEYEALLGAG
ncbi:MAG: type II toxin-antitoxin system RelE family toxin [Spirulinaceae cyanobacterium]